MKDIHDKDTIDMGAVYSTFGLLDKEGHIKRVKAVLPELSDTEILRRLKRYRYYLREKPYLAKALRRR